ncbi:MAG: hypothetical protein MJY42_01175 [Bacteroidales bacterium]|nr:hypothetical protein [Bacteroidales bacterium]
MRYFIRAAKYFVELTIILVLVIVLLMAFKVVDTDIDTLFINGRDSLWQIALIMVVFAAVYPRFGFLKRRLRIAGSFEEIFPTVEQVMAAGGYELESRDGENLAYRIRSKAARITRMGEDRITLTRSLGGFEIEGPGKDIARIISRFSRLETEGE